jgi:hypothetical protein
MAESLGRALQNVDVRHHPIRAKDALDYHYALKPLLSDIRRILGLDTVLQLWWFYAAALGIHGLDVRLYTLLIAR